MFFRNQKNSKFKASFTLFINWPCVTLCSRWRGWTNIYIKNSIHSILTTETNSNIVAFVSTESGADSDKWIESGKIKFYSCCSPQNFLNMVVHLMKSLLIVVSIIQSLSLKRYQWTWRIEKFVTYFQTVVLLCLYMQLYLVWHKITIMKKTMLIELF